MSEPIDLTARRNERVPEPEADPLIVMPVDSDQIIFRDQSALDDYVAGANAALRDAITQLAKGKVLVHASTLRALIQSDTGAKP